VGTGRVTSSEAAPGSSKIDAALYGIYLGLCALAVPDGFTAGGLPLSLQIVCQAGEEAMALRIGWAYEQATDWHERRPPEPATAKP